MAAKKQEKHTHEGHSHEPITRKDDGALELVFDIPWNEIEKRREETAHEMGKNLTIAGFRKGMAPLDRLMRELPASELLERTLAKILPTKLAHIITEHKVHPAMYPKFELLHATEGEDWTIKAITCEIPEFKLENYKEAVKKALSEVKADASIEEKQNAALTALAKAIEIKVPALLIEEEANGRLGNLVTRLEKLGITLENYLSSQKKTAPELRSEYEKNAEETLKMELALGKIADDEKISVSDAEVTAFISVAQLNAENTDPESQKSMVKSVLTKRKTIEFLTNLS